MDWHIDESKFLTPEEVRRLRAGLSDASRSGHRRAMVRWMIVDLGLSTGLRASEMASLRIEDCGAQSILVRRGKGGKTAPVVISEVFRRHLRDFIKWRAVDSGPLLINERCQPYTRIGIYKLVKKAFSDLGLPGHYSAHSLRHTFCSTLYRATKDLRLVQQQARHSSPNVTTVYANLLDEEVAAGMERMFI
jgi:integrase/recombinase XerD